MLLRPVPLFALVLLVANDHFLKYAGLLPGWLTGKLSDFAGMVVAPVVLVEALQLLRVRGTLRMHGLIACALTGVVFALLKTVPHFNAVYLSVSKTLLSPLGWHVSALLDATDLLALSALAVPLFLTRRA